MRYLFINVVAGSGSTGKIAADKCRELQAQGHQCVLAYGRTKANCEDIETYRIGTGLDYRLHGSYTRLFDQHGFGSKSATKKFLKWAEEYNPDIIWLHNIHGYYINVEILFRWLKAYPEKKVIWTLHDCWAVTGHCAYFTAVKCDKWKTQCQQCPQKGSYPSSILFSNAPNNFERKKRAFTGVEGMKLVVPSHWLEGIVKESFLKEYEVEVIHNKIDTNIFKPTPSNFRKTYGLENKKIILGVANVWDERKGLNDFIKLSQMLDERYVIVLVGLNKKQIRNLCKEIKIIECIDYKVETQACENRVVIYSSTTYEKIVQHAENKADAEGIAVPADVNSLYDCITNILGNGTKLLKPAERFICIGNIANAYELAAVYTMADVFVNPTYEDNYPTVNLEARACGTLVITYDVGGCRETL